MGEFRGEHTDERVAGGAGLVALGVRSDVLGADADDGVFFVLDNFDMIGFFAELVVVGGGGGESCVGVVGDDADGATLTLQDRFQLERVCLARTSGGFFRVIGEAESDFSRRKSSKII